MRDELRAKEQKLRELSQTQNALLKEGRERTEQRIGRLQDEIANRQVFEGLGSKVASISGNLEHLQGTFSTDNKINTLFEGRVRFWFALDPISLSDFSTEAAKRSQNFFRPDPRRSNWATTEQAAILVGPNPAIIGCEAIVKRLAEPSTRYWGKLSGENTGKGS